MAEITSPIMLDSTGQAIVSAINNISMDAVKKGDITTVSGVTGNFSAPAITEILYPTGYNFNNCIIIAAYMQVSATIKGFLPPHCYAQLRSNAIAMYQDGDASVRNLPYTIVIMKI